MTATRSASTPAARAERKRLERSEWKHLGPYLSGLVADVIIRVSARRMAAAS